MVGPRSERGAEEREGETDLVRELEEHRNPRFHRSRSESGSHQATLTAVDVACGKSSSAGRGKKENKARTVRSRDTTSEKHVNVGQQDGRLRVRVDMGVEDVIECSGVCK
jgi:hypothetical protein